MLTVGLLLNVGFTEVGACGEGAGIIGAGSDEGGSGMQRMSSPIKQPTLSYKSSHPVKKRFSTTEVASSTTSITIETPSPIMGIPSINARASKLDCSEGAIVGFGVAFVATVIEGLVDVEGSKEDDGADEGFDEIDGFIDGVMDGETS